MIETLKKSMYAAIGLAVMTQEKVEELGKKIVKETQMSEGEGKKFIDELLKKSEDAKAAIEKMINERVDMALSKMNIASKKEFLDLEKRVCKLEAASMTKDIK